VNGTKKKLTEKATKNLPIEHFLRAFSYSSLFTAHTHKMEYQAHKTNKNLLERQQRNKTRREIRKSAKKNKA